MSLFPRQLSGERSPHGSTSFLKSMMKTNIRCKVYLIMVALLLGSGMAMPNSLTAS